MTLLKKYFDNLTMPYGRNLGGYNLVVTRMKLVKIRILTVMLAFLVS